MIALIEQDAEIASASCFHSGENSAGLDALGETPGDCPGSHPIAPQRPDPRHQEVIHTDVARDLPGQDQSARQYQEQRVDAHHTGQG